MMPNAKLEFSLIIATHNRATLLERAVKSAVEQTYPFKKIIVVSDVGDLDTINALSKIMRTNDLFVQRYGGAGPSESRNAGLKLVDTDFFIFLDDDDSFHPDFLKNIAEKINDEKYKKSNVFFTNFELINEVFEGTTPVTQDMQEIDISGYDADSVFVKNYIPNNCFIFPAELKELISYDSRIAYEDWDFALSALDKMPLKYLPVFGARVHKNQSESVVARGKSNEPELLDCYLAVYTKHKPLNTKIDAQRRDLFSSIGLDLDSLLQRASI